MLSVAVRRIERAEPELIAGLKELGAATVHEAQGRTGLMAAELSPIVPGATMGGSAVTALCPSGDNWMLHVAIELMQPGDVLVVATTSPCDDGYFGGILAEYIKLRGGVGAVVDAGVRDVRELREQGFPVWSRRVSAQGTVKETVGAVNVPVICAGQRVVPGDIVLGDDDGVVVVPRLKAATVLTNARLRLEKENAIRAKLREGGHTLDLLNLRDKLAQKGLRYIDGPVSWDAKENL